MHLLNKIYNESRSLLDRDFTLRAFVKNLLFTLSKTAKLYNVVH